MATGLMTVTTADKHIGEVWPGDVLRAQEFDLVIAPRVYRQWKFVGHGDVYHILRIPNIEAETKSASTSLTKRTYTDTEQTITINVHQGAAFEIESITKILSNTDLEMEMQKKIGYALGRALDVNLAALPGSFSQIVGAYTNELTYDDAVDAQNYLADAGIDLSDDCTWFISPGAESGFLRQEIFINQMYQGSDNRAVNTAKVANLLGAPVLRSNLTKAPSAGQSDSWLMYRKAIALIQALQPTIETERIAIDLSTIVVGQQLYGSAEVDRYSEAAGNITATDEWAVLLKTIA